MFPETVNAIESKDDAAEMAAFEEVFTGGQAEVGEIINLGTNTASNLVELEGSDMPPHEVYYTTTIAYAVVTDDGETTVNLGIEMNTDMPARAFDLSNEPVSIDNWVRYTKLDANGKILAAGPAAAVTCS